MPKLTILPHNIELEISSDENLLEALREKDIYVKSSCGGHASCSDCIIKIAQGKENLKEPTFDEIQLLGNVFHITKERLSCQTYLTGDATIDISSHNLKIDLEKVKQKDSEYAVSRLRKKKEVEDIKTERIKKKEELKNKDKDRGGRTRPKLFRTDKLEDSNSDKEEKS